MVFLFLVAFGVSGVSGCGWAFVIEKKTLTFLV